MPIFTLSGMIYYSVAVIYTVSTLLANALLLLLFVLQRLFVSAGSHAGGGVECAGRSAAARENRHEL
jgi:hypothetical protein